MMLAIVGMIALSGWLLWPEWRKFQTVRLLRRDFESLIRNCDHDVKLHADAYAAATSRGGEVKNVRGEALATEFLLPMLKNDCAKVRMHTAVFLEQIGPGAKDAIPDLMDALRDENAVVRLRTAVALAEFGTTANRAVPALIDTLQDEDDYVSAAAARAVRRIAQRVAVKFVTEHAEDRQLSPKVIDILLHYDYEKEMEAKTMAF